MAKRKGSWTASEIEYLRQHYGKQATRDIARHLRRTYSATRSTVKRLHITTGRRRPWTKEDLEAVRRLYPHRPTQEIAAKLGRDIECVYRKAAIMGLKKTEE